MSDFSQNNLLHRMIKTTDPVIFQQWQASGPYSAVNDENRWHQTPLHYAAKKSNDYLLYLFMQFPDANVTKQDINGYNVLHCLVYNILTIFDWKTCIKHLVNRGIDINQQTRLGNSVLHLACRISTSPCVLQHFLESVPNIEVNLTNCNKENFLHLFIRVLNKCSPVSKDFKERIKLLKTLSKGKFKSCPKDVLANVFSQRDVNGQTPFLLILSKCARYRSVNIYELLELLLSVNTTCASIPDNLNNSPLSYAVACIQTTTHELIEMLTKCKADVNAKNIFGQSMVHVARVHTKEMVQDRLMTMQNLLDLGFVDNGDCDIWQCSPLMYFSAALAPDGQLQLKDDNKETSKVVRNINTGDVNGSTALHYAAYHDAASFANFLIQQGANCEKEDNLGDKPIQTARRNFSTYVEEAIMKSAPSSSSLENENQSYVDELKALKTSGVITGDMDNLTTKMLSHGFYDISQEKEQINDTISFFIHLLCKQIATYDVRFTMTPFQSGSSAEKTKVNDPDEFDYVLCLERFGDISEICLNDGSFNSVLKVNDPQSQEYFEFFNDKGHLITPPVFMYLHQYLKRALYEPDLWKDERLKNIGYIFESEFLEKNMVTTVFMVHLLWVGCRYKHLRIKIDLVPAIRKKSWWPKNRDAFPLMTKDIKESACLLMLDPVDDIESFTSSYLKEVVTDNINRINDGYTNLRISNAPAEVCLMRSFPQIVRESYALSKLFIEIVQPEKITSYMLKNCTFYIMAEMKWSVNQTEINITTRQLSIRIFESLLRFNQKGKLPRFFMPDINIFPVDEDIGDRNSREFHLKLVIALLREDLKHNPEATKRSLMKYTAEGALSISSDLQIPSDDESESETSSEEDGEILYSRRK